MNKKTKASSRHSPLVRGLCVTAAALVLTLAANDAQAIRLTMKRVMFEGSQRTADLTIINNTAEEQVYRLGFKTMRMTQGDGLETLEDGVQDPALKSADSMVRFSPRRVTIPAGGSQQVRLMLNKPKDVADGEYRSHFWIRPEAESAKFDPAPQDNAASGPSVQIKMLAGVTLPVFVRVGPMNVTATIANAKAERKGERIAVSMDINREGNRSLYGDVEFTCNGKVLHQVRGIAVYTEIAKRTVRLNVPVPKDGFGGCSAMDVIYRAETADAQYKGGVIAQTQVAIP
ncbi:fimbrial biogenesis chaperone [Micavibrio aeruginosavorus]|uniref:fimbrial biogenesis chaperone n=1 Tax=Micavibrio aeruginosavorus TaxID=349221 RepID=UPI003F4AE1BC